MEANAANYTNDSHEKPNSCSRNGEDFHDASTSETKMATSTIIHQTPETNLPSMLRPPLRGSVQHPVSNPTKHPYLIPYMPSEPSSFSSYMPFVQPSPQMYQMMMQNPFGASLINKIPSPPQPGVGVNQMQIPHFAEPHRTTPINRTHYESNGTNYEAPNNNPNLRNAPSTGNIALPISSSSAANLSPSNITASTVIEADNNDVGIPESWESIKDTYWYRVETSRGLNYFYNKKTDKSVWLCPPELQEKVKELDEDVSEEIEAAETLSAKTDQVPKEGEESNEDPEADSSISDSSSSSSSSSSSFPLNPINLKQLMRQEKFISEFEDLLREHKFGPFVSYDKVLSKLIFDARFKAIPAHLRKSLFQRSLQRLEKLRVVNISQHVANLKALFEEMEKNGLPVTVSYIESHYSKDPRWTGSESEVWKEVRIKILYEHIRMLKKIQKKKDEIAKSVNAQFLYEAICIFTF